MRRIIVAILVLAAAAGAAQHLRRRKRDFIAKQVELMSSSDRRTAGEARRTLQRCGPSAVRPVIALLDDPDPAVRARAAQCLANIGHAAAAGPLFEHAKAGDYPAARALVALKHPRAKEALAWPPAITGNCKLRETLHRLPAGGDRLPMELEEPCIPGRRPRHRWDEAAYTGLLGWDNLAGLFYEANHGLSQALQLHPLPTAILGMAKLHELCGDYEAAYGLYKELLSDDPHHPDGREGLARTERLLKMARQMEALLPPAYRVRQVLGHDAWKAPGETYRVALISYPHRELSFMTHWPKLVVYRFRGGEVVKVSSLPPVGWSRYSTQAIWVGLAYAKNEPAPLLVVVTGLGRWSYRSPKTLQLYRLRNGNLVRLARMSSTLRPTVCDLDGDGRVEILLWTWAPTIRAPWSVPPWPAVYRVQGDRLADCTGEHPRIFALAAPILRDLADEWDDCKCWEAAGRAFENCGELKKAIEAYEAAERGYLSKRGDYERRGNQYQARAFGEKAREARRRWKRLMAETGEE